MEDISHLEIHSFPDFVFEVGKLILKIELSKSHSKDIISKQGGTVNEEILFQKISKFWNQQNKFDRPDGLLVVTTHRIVFLKKIKTILSKTEFLSIPFEVVENMEKIKLWLITPAIKFIALGQVFVFTFLNSENVQDIINIMHNKSIAESGADTAQHQQ